MKYWQERKEPKERNCIYPLFYIYKLLKVSGGMFPRNFLWQVI